MADGDAGLDEADLIATAMAETGLSDFGGEDFRSGLRVLIETYQQNGFDERGRKRRVRRERQDQQDGRQRHGAPKGGAPHASREPADTR